MSSRDKILGAVRRSQPAFKQLPDISVLEAGQSPPEEGWRRESQTNSEGISIAVPGWVSKFTTSLQSIGGHAKPVTSFEEIISSIKYQFPGAKRMVSTFSELNSIAEIYCNEDVIHKPEEIDVVILPAHFGVAENGAVWLTENLMCDRALPFICQHLVTIIKAETIVPDMHAAYNKIADADYGFGIFIAGPSKTADIEQSLVLGAHGPISMTVFVLK